MRRGDAHHSTPQSGSRLFFYLPTIRQGVKEGPKAGKGGGQAGKRVDRLGRVAVPSLTLRGRRLILVGRANHIRVRFSRRRKLPQIRPSFSCQECKKPRILSLRYRSGERLGGAVLIPVGAPGAAGVGSQPMGIAGGTVSGWDRLNQVLR
jgi:hypothetical protein